MTEQRDPPGEDPHLKTLQERWEKEWGPEISPWKRRIFAAFVIGALVALVVTAFVTVR